MRLDKTIEMTETKGALDGILKYDTNVKNIERVKKGEHIKFNNGKESLKKVYLKPQNRK